MSQIWDDIVKTALLGTERQAPSMQATGGALGEAIGQLKGRAPEAAVLAMAAVVSVYRKAGQRPVSRKKGTVPATAPDDLSDLPRIGEPAAQQLARMLAGEFREILPEWLVAAAAGKRRVTEELLPALLDLAKAQSSLRAGVAAVIGGRGRWLAAQNPDWSFASIEGDDESTWETGNRVARLTLLNRVRPVRPQRAVALIRLTWDRETADDRAAMLATLVENLEPADELFLEPVLDDRSKIVRQRAAELLAAIPESAFCQRMIQRVSPLLRWKDGKNPAIEVTLPAEPDAATLRDAIDPVKPRHGVEQKWGQKAWWLFQMLSLTPPAIWSKQWGKTPEQILAASRGNEWEGPLVSAWLLAAARVRDAAWAEALWDQHSDSKQNLAQTENAAAGLLAALPERRREELLLRRIGSGAVPFAEDASTIRLLLQKRGWSVSFAREVFRMIKQAPRDFSDAYYLQSSLPGFANHLPIELLPELSTGWPLDGQNGSRWKKSVDEMLAILQFRHDLYLSFNA